MKLRTLEQLDKVLSREQVFHYLAEGPPAIQSYELGSLAVCYSVVRLPEEKRPFPMATTIAAGGIATGHRPIVILSDDVPIEFQGPWAVSEQLARELAGAEAPNPRLMAEQAVIERLREENPIYWAKYAQARAEYLKNLGQFVSKASDKLVDISDYASAASFLAKQAENASSI